VSHSTVARTWARSSLPRYRLAIGGEKEIRIQLMYLSRAKLVATMGRSLSAAGSGRNGDTQHVHRSAWKRHMFEERPCLAGRSGQKPLKLGCL
jgi:hypothetical protein